MEEGSESKKISRKCTLSDWFSVCVLGLFVLVFYVPMNPTHRFWMSLALVALGFGLTFYSRELRHRRELRSPVNDEYGILDKIKRYFDDSGDTRERPEGQYGDKIKEYFERPEVVLGTMYAIIAGFAFTEGLKVYHTDIATLSSPHKPWDFYTPFLKNADVLFRLMSFIAVALPFYHGGILTLLKSKVEKHKLLIFIMMFFLAIMLYLIGTSIDYIYVFAGLIFVLMVVDAGWVSYMKCKLEDDSFAIEWAQLNFITAGFFGMFLLLPVNLQSQDMTYISLMFFIVLSLRTVLDYFFQWELYSKPFGRSGHSSQDSNR